MNYGHQTCTSIRLRAIEFKIEVLSIDKARGVAVAS